MVKCSENSASAGIGVDTTGSTPMPVDAKSRPLALDPKWKGNLAAQAWLWKDHTGHAEAAAITAAARKAGDFAATKALARDLGFTPIHLHYNSGLHISTNGRRFAAMLERLLSQPLPEPESEIRTAEPGASFGEESTIGSARRAKCPRSRSRAVAPRPWKRCWPATGPAISGSSRTRSNGR